MKIKLSELKQIIKEESQKIAMSFSDTKVGTAELGYIDRIDGEDPDAEDDRYQAYLKKQGLNAFVATGDVFLREDINKTINIKLSELKKIIRKESLSESFSPMKSIAPPQKNKVSILLEDLTKATKDFETGMSDFLSAFDNEDSLGDPKKAKELLAKIKKDLAALADEIKKEVN